MSPEPLFVNVDDEHHELEITMEPRRTAVALQLLLADGAAASSAEAWAFSDAMQPVWRGSANASGTIDVPDAAAGALLLVRHPNAASTIRRVAASEKSISWTLAPPAAPLTVVSADGRTAMVALWLDGVKLTGPPLAFATWSLPMSAPNGLWTARNLPARTVELRMFAPVDAASNAFDAVPQRVAHPWPSRVIAQR